MIRSDRSRWLLVVAPLMLVVALAHFNRVSISVAGAEQIIKHDGISETRMGTVYLALLLLYTLAMVPTGWLIDRIGARMALLILCFASVIFVSATGIVGAVARSSASLWMGLLVVRSALGIVSAPLHPAAARMVFTQVPYQSRSFANGLVTFAACIGISATYYGFGALMSRFGWPRAFVASSAFTLAVGFVWLWSTRKIETESAERPVRGSAAPVHRVLRNPGVICLTLSYGAVGYFQYLFFYWIQYYFGEVQQLGNEISRGYVTIITLAMGVGMMCGGWLTDRVPLQLSGRLGRGVVPVLGMIASGIVFEVGVWHVDSDVTAAAFTVSAALLGAVEGAFWTTANELGGSRGGLAGGVMNMGGNAAGLLSPVATPLLSAYFTRQYGSGMGWRLSLTVAGLVSIFGALLWFGVVDRRASDPGVDAGGTEPPVR